MASKSKSKHIDLEIKDASLIFDSVWSDLEQEFGRAKLCFPGEIIWLGGAPGAGKGTNTPFILEARGITAAAVVVSNLLDSPRAQQIKNAGGLVGDEEVTYLLLHKLLDPIYERGVIVDGFPRTQVQVECLKLFYDKMTELREEFRNHNFPRPLFRSVLLFVDEEVSIERQLHRGREAQEHNRKATESGVGQLAEIRATDLDPAAARKRYQVFKETTFEALRSLRAIFHFRFIDASQPLAEVQQEIEEEFSYQSSLELSHKTLRPRPHHHASQPPRALRPPRAGQAARDLQRGSSRAVSAGHRQSQLQVHAHCHPLCHYRHDARQLRGLAL